MDASLALLHRVAASTVTITAEVPASHPSAAILGTQRVGSGTVVAPDGVILTVNYVALGAGPVTVVDVGGNRYEGRVAAQDFTTGVAVIRSGASSLPVIESGSSADIKIGDDVMTVASAGAGDRRSAWGSVTSLEAFEANWEYVLERALWATGTNPGPGGGPLCDAKARMVGIVSLNMGMLGRSILAIPSENYYDHAEELLTHGQRVTRPRRAWLGLFCAASEEGATVVHLIPGSPGDAGGLRAEDVILRIDGSEISCHTDLYKRIWAHKPGDSLEFYVYRKGRLLTFPLTAGDAEEFLG